MRTDIPARFAIAGFCAATFERSLHRALRPAAAFVLLLAVAGAASAQTLTTGAVAVRITDRSGEPLTEVLLTLSDSAAGVTRQETADRQGRFLFSALPPGDYDLTAERIGFAPRRVAPITVRPEQVQTVAVELPPVGEAGLDAGRALTGGISAPAGARQWIPRAVFRAVPGPDRSVDEVGRFASNADDRFAVEGLPAHLSSLAIDGMPFRAAAHPSTYRQPVRTTAFAAPGIDAAQLITNPVDVEWSGAAAALLSTYSRRGASSTRGDIFASWSGDALAASSIEGDVSYSDLQGGFTLGGPLSGDGSRYGIGVTARRSETPSGAAWPESEAATRLIETDARLSDYGSPAVTAYDAMAGFAHIDWAMADAHRVEAGVHAAAMPKLGMLDPRSGAVTELDGVDLLTNVALLSTLSERLDNELRVSLTSSERGTVDDDEAIPFTRVVGDALAFGTRSHIASARDAQLRISDALHYRRGAHALKLGGMVMLGAYRYEMNSDPAGAYLYGDVDQLLAGTGVFERNEGVTPLADWTDRTFALFVQDRITMGAGLELLAGLRLERQTMPSGVRRDEEWATLTGIGNDLVDEPELRLSPRASLSWDVGQRQRTVLHAGGGIYYDRLDPLLLATWQTDDGTADVRRVVGALAWPPAGSPAGPTAARLTLLGPGFEAPRTLRATGGIVSSPLTGTTFSLTGVVRRTENLPRRTDLNLVQLPVAQDQHGRDVFGTLVHQGGLLAALPGSNRRFTTYDEVAAITADGVSEHWGITAAIEHEMNAALSIIARYTFGKSTDDWFGAQGGGWMQPMPRGVGEDWLEGTSDFDVPHRAVVGAAVTGPIGMRAGVAYRLQSGRAFTPGFRPGVDANADGSSHNDPAFVDESISGMSDVMADNSCLRESVGEFAGRNSCRAPMVHALDLGIDVPVFRVGGGTASVTIDALDVLESAHEVPDAALYLIDPDGVLVTDPVARTVTLPLIANPDFGEPLTRRAPGRTLRLGFSFNW